MSKIRALNEEPSSSESEDETNPKLSKEAQEELAKLKYNQALKTLAEGRKPEAAELLEKLLIDPCLQNPQDDTKQIAPFQQQLQLGCYKILADLYRDGECKDLVRSKSMYERAIFVDQDENINLWYRLGKVSFEEGDLYTAHHAFSYALQLRPSHWGCLENMVTISYAVQDYIGCLRHCAVGLSRDSKFFKGFVFRDLVYNVIPELKVKTEEHIKHFKALNLPGDCNDFWRDKYINELRKVEANAKDRISSIQKEILIVKPKIHLNLKSLTLVEVLKEVLTVYEDSFDNLDFHKNVELTWKVQDANVDSDDFGKPVTTEESQTEEESQSGIPQSRSSSNEKENPAIPSDGTSASQQEATNEKKTTENSENSQPALEGSQNMDETGNKKKSKGNVKWWQMEGKRRSQRVRGHLIPVSPDKAKKESSFADQLKNLIPASLLADDGSVSERDLSKSPEKGRWQKKLNLNYFGTKDEEMHVKQLLAIFSSEVLLNLPKILIKMAQFLTSKVKYPWPVELRDLFLKLYKYYRSHVDFPNVQDYELVHVIGNAYISLTYLEILFEKYKTELSSGDKSYVDLISKEIFFLEECQSCYSSFPKDFNLRGKWLTVRRLLNMASLLNYEEANENATELLLEMEEDLRNDPLRIWTVNETSNFICLESVSEKSVGITKMQNSQTVTDLYQSHQYESLIGVLQSSINFCEVEKRDLSDIYFYSVALFRTDKPECIYQCVNLTNLALKFQENSILAKTLLLLDEIWQKMKNKFTLQDKRLAVGSLIKILVACEGKPPPQELIMCIPWCILHSITFSLEREEPALYLEEDTLPNSIFLLQMAHECMTRSEKCCVDSGRLMLYTMKAILQVKKLEEYIAFEETRYCMEQAIYCLYSHPSKKSKAKNFKDHNSSGIILTWEMCPILYQYYTPEELPEFDSYGSIGAEVESLFQRLLDMMPSELKPTEGQAKINSGIETCDPLDDLQTCQKFPTEIQDIYYLIGDYYFKSKEWSKAVTYYTWDLAVVPSRFDSWAAIALSLGEDINTTLNTADVIDFKELLRKAQSTAHCFRNALKFDPANVKLRIEFGSFVYAMHAYCSRLLKHQTANVDMELFKVIENAKEDFLKSSFKCFEPIVKDSKTDDGNQSSETIEDEIWIHHYMLGKINEKRLFREDAEEFLKQYELAGKLLHDQGAPYPAKMNYYSPPELAIEALEIYYRIHASILTLVEHADYSLATERFYLQFIRRLDNSPFVKCKQSRGEGGDGKRGRKPAEESISKKEMAEVNSVMKQLLDNTEKLVESNPQASCTTSTATSTTTTDDDTSTDSVKSAPVTESAHVRSFCLSEFKKRLQEKELREEKLANATETKKSEDHATATSPTQLSTTSAVETEVDIYEGFNLENNHFYEAFKDVKFGAVVALCLKGMEECITRYPSHFKSYYRLAHSYMVFLKDAKKAKEYLMGSPELSQRKIAGLFGERKANNFFNGIWRNPIDDIDRPGSFSYHMNKIMQLLLDVLSNLNDHQLLVEIVLQLSKIPDNEKKYLSNPDREMFCQQAVKCCVVSVKRKISEPGVNYHELGIEAFETYSKLQKFSPRQNPVGLLLHDIYKAYLSSQCISSEIPTLEQAIRYFTFHQLSLKASRASAKNTSSQNSGDSQKTNGGDAPPRKRGRRAARAASQETVEPPLPSTQDFDMYNAVSAAFQANNFINDSSPPYHSIIPSVSSMYPTMSLGAVHSMINPLLNKVDAMIRTDPRNNSFETMTPGEAHRSNLQSMVKGDTHNQNKTPQPAHESSRGALKTMVTSQSSIIPISAAPTSSAVVSKSPPQPAAASMSIFKKSSKDKTLPTLKSGNPSPSINKPTVSGPPKPVLLNPSVSKAAPSVHKPSLSEAPLSSNVQPRQLSITKQFAMFQPEPIVLYPGTSGRGLPLLNPIRINTSPFKAQSTAMEQPPRFQFNNPKSSATEMSSLTDSRSGIRKAPPAAHSNAPRKKPRTEDQEGQDVMDLTVKTPEKESPKMPAMRSETVSVPSNTGYRKLTLPPSRNSTPLQNQVPKVTSYPLPPKKKHQQLLFRSSPPAPNPPGKAGGDIHDDDDDVICLD